MKSLVVILVCVGVAMAQVDSCRDPKDYELTRKTKRSAAKDDAKAEISCPVKYEMTRCACESLANDPAGCDGARIEENKDGYKCVAINSAKGKGVSAVATCAKVVVYCATKYKDDPKIRCPKNYRLISCALFTPYRQRLVKEGFNPESRKDGGLCKVTKGCAKCSVQATCLRNGNVFDE